MCRNTPNWASAASLLRIIDRTQLGINSSEQAIYTSQSVATCRTHHKKYNRRNNNAVSGIGTRDPSNRAAADLRFKPHRNQRMTRYLLFFTEHSTTRVRVLWDTQLNTACVVLPNALRTRCVLEPPDSVSEVPLAWWCPSARCHLSCREFLEDCSSDERVAEQQPLHLSRWRCCGSDWLVSTMGSSPVLQEPVTFMRQSVSWFKCVCVCVCVCVWFTQPAKKHGPELGLAEIPTRVITGRVAM